MKKLIALFIAISCLFCVVSCNDGGDNPPSAPEIPVSEGGISFSEFVKATAATAAPASAVISTSRENDYGTLEAVLNITYAQDGSLVIEYERERYGSIVAGEDNIVTETGRVTCDKNGNYSDGGELAGNVVASGAFALNLDEYKLNDARIEGNILYATVFSADTEAVLGINLAATTLIAVTIVDGKISTVSARYTKGGADIDVRCDYGY